MQHAWPVTLAFSLLLALPAVPVPALGGPPPNNLPEARPAPLYNPVSKCPRVRIADEGTIAVVVFLVGSTGVPSKASIGKSSQSKDLDAAALECVTKLRFLPSVRVGEGTAVDAWQKLGWRWTQPSQADAGGSGTTQTSAAAAAPAPAAASPAAAATAPAAVATAGSAGGAALAGAAAAAPAASAGTGAARASAAAAPVELRVCADEAGRLSQEPTIVHSSGNPGLDQAALRIAKSGSGNYRPAPTLNGKPATGCAQVSIRFE